jgi:hypothetical protein
MKNNRKNRALIKIRLKNHGKPEMVGTWLHLLSHMGRDFSGCRQNWRPLKPQYVYRTAQYRKSRRGMPPRPKFKRTYLKTKPKKK